MGQDMPTSANISLSEDMNLQESIREDLGTVKDMRVEWNLMRLVPKTTMNTMSNMLSILGDKIHLFTLCLDPLEASLHFIVISPDLNFTLEYVSEHHTLGMLMKKDREN